MFPKTEVGNNSLRPFHRDDIQIRLSRVHPLPHREGRMKLISLNVARPRLALYHGTTINTGIFKQPVSGPVQLRTLNLDGDRQADLTVHGGTYKADRKNT